MTGSHAAFSDADLDLALRALHGSGRAAELSAAHLAAADRRHGREARFHLTHAWVFALEAGADVAAIEARLRALGGL